MLSVYKQLTLSTENCLDVIKREIGMKTSCVPFAVKLMSALKTLNVKTEQDTLNAANVLLGGLQTLMQGGIVAEDYDKIDFVKRGKTIVPSARVEAFLRAASRKGYRITDTIVAVPQEDADTTYFEENFYNGDIIYTLKDERHNSDRAVTAERLAQKYFAKFLCRLDIHDVRQNQRVAMTVCEMPIEDMLAVAATSEQGLYQSKWEEYNTQWGVKKRKVISDELNTDTFWIKWTGEMVNKTIIRRALKRVKEVLPELTDAIYAFEQDCYIPQQTKADTLPPIEIPAETVTEDIDINNLTEAQLLEAAEVYDIYMANPKLAVDKTSEIKRMFENGMAAQEVINKEYASIYVLKKSKKRWTEIGGYFDEKGKAQAGNA